MDRPRDEVRTAARAELARKAVHLAMGGFALLLRWLTPLQAATCAAGALLFNLFVLHRVTRRALLRPHERERGFSAGIVLYPAAVLGLILVFHQRLELAAATWALLAFGDGMATVAGVTLGGPRLPWNREKTWAGLAAFVVYGGLSAALLIRWVQQGVLDALPWREAVSVDWIGASFFSRGAGPTPPAEMGLLLAGCLAAAAVAAVVESLRTGVDDNVLVPLFGGAALFAATLVEPERVVAGMPDLLRNAGWGGAVSLFMAIGAYAARGVTRSGAVTGWIIATLLFAWGGWRGFLMLLLFFVLGTLSTMVGYGRKAALGIAQEHEGRRGAKHALANVTVGLLFAFLAAGTGYPDAFRLALVAAFATAAADTVSSEFGQAYGRTHYLVTSFRRVEPGTQGAVSLEGTLAGVLASLVVAASAWGVGLVASPGIAVVALAAFLGTTAESYLGATVQRDGLLDNELVNFANTLVGGVAALGIWGLVAVLA